MSILDDLGLPSYTDPILDPEEEEEEEEEEPSWLDLIKSVGRDVAASRVAQMHEPTQFPLERAAAQAASLPKNIAETARLKMGAMRDKDVTGLADTMSPFLDRADAFLAKTPGLTTGEVKSLPIITKELREVEREKILGDDPSRMKRAGVFGAEIGTEIAMTAPEALLTGGAGGAAAKSLPWIRRLAKTRPLAAGALTGGTVAGIEGAVEESWLSRGLDPKERALRTAFGGAAGLGIGGLAGRWGAKKTAREIANQEDLLEQAVDDFLGGETVAKIDDLVRREFGPGEPGTRGIPLEMEKELHEAGRVRSGRIKREAARLAINQEQVKMRSNEFLETELGHEWKMRNDLTGASPEEAQKRLVMEMYEDPEAMARMANLDPQLGVSAVKVRKHLDGLSEEYKGFLTDVVDRRVDELSANRSYAEDKALREGKSPSYDIAGYGQGVHRRAVQQDVEELASITADNYAQVIRRVIKRQPVFAKSLERQEEILETRATTAMRQFQDALKSEGRLLDEMTNEDVLDQAMTLSRMQPYARAVRSQATINKIEANKGKYMYRTYRMFDDPEWAKNRVNQVKDLDVARGSVEANMPDTARLKKAFSEVTEAALDHLHSTIPNAKKGRYFLEVEELMEDGSMVVSFDRTSPTLEGVRKAEQAVFQSMDRNANPMEWSGAGRIPGLDLGPLHRRKDLDKHIRYLYGEQDDPFLRMEKSGALLATDLETYKYLDNVRDALLDSGLARTEAIPEEGFVHQVNTGTTRGPMGFENSVDQITDNVGFEYMNELDTLWVNDANLAEMLNGMPSKVRGGVMNAINAWTHMAKTVGSVQTHSRNFLGNQAFVLAQGHNPFSILTRKGSPEKAAAKQARVASRLEGREVTGKLLGGQKKVDEAVLNFDMPGFEEFTDRYLDLLERGISETVALKDLDRYYRAIKSGNAGAIARAAEMGVENKAAKGVKEAYHIEDYFWKAYTYDLELKRLVNEGVFPDTTAAKRYALDAMEDSLPIYPKIPKIVKRIRNAPVIGPFVSFPSELVRTSVNTFKRTVQEIKAPELVLQKYVNPEDITEEMINGVRRIGMERAGGMLAVASAPMAFAFGTRMIAGMDNNEDAAARSFMPPWSDSAAVGWLGSDKANSTYAYTDISYLAPHSIFLTPVRNLARAAFDPRLSAVQAMGMTAEEYYTTFMSPEVALTEFMSGVKDWDQVSELGLEEQMGLVFHRAWRALAPGVATSAERITRASGLMEDRLPGTTRYGTEFDLGQELFALVGPRSKTFVTSEALTWKGKEYARAYRQSRSLIDREKTRKETSPDRVLRATIDAQQNYVRASKKMLRFVGNARSLHMSEDQIKASLKSARLSNAEIAALLRGEIPDFQPPKWSL